MATGAPGLFFASMIKAFHDAAYDLPEDFFERVEDGVDPETRARLVAGFQAGARMTQIRTWAWLLLVFGLLTVFAAYFAGGVAALLYLALLTTGGAWIVASILLYVYAYTVFLAHRQDVHTFLAFVHAARDSSLGRDLA